MRAELLEPRRVRYPKGAYGWVDLRIVTEGYLEALGPPAALAYLFLCTVGNREGMSFWSRTRMARMLNLPLDVIDAALQLLSSTGLVAATARVVQVLPLPDRDAAASDTPQANHQPPPRSGPPPQAPTEAPPDVSEEEIRAQESTARATIARFYGTREPRASVLRGLARALALKAREGRK